MNKAQRGTSAGLALAMLTASTCIAAPYEREGGRVSISNEVFSTPSAATLDGGELVVAWQTGRPSCNGKLFSAQRKLIKQFPITTNPSLPEARPAVAAVGQGGFVVVWQVQKPTPRACGQIYSPRGDPISEQFFISAAQADARPARVYHPDGFVVTWEVAKGGPAGGVYAQRFDLKGNRRGESIKVNREPGMDSAYVWYNPRAVGLLDGTWVVTWHVNVGIDNYEVRAKFYYPDGTESDEIFVNTETLGRQSAPSIAGLAASNAVAIAWQDIDLSIANAQLFDARGSRIGPEILVNPQPFARGPIVTPAVAGGFAVVFEAGSLYDKLVGRVFSATGVPVGSEMAVSDHGTARGPAVAPLLGGGLVALWTDIYSCYSQHFAPRIDKCTEVPR